MPVPVDGVPALEDRLAVGLALRKARKEAGLETAQAAEKGGISVSTLGAIERGTHSLTSVSAGNLARLPAAWGLSWHKFVEIVSPVYGAYIPLLTRPLTDAERRGWVLPEDEDEPEIPEALQIAAQKYGHGDNAGLAERRWLLELADLDFREEPETPEDWLAIYSRLSKLINPKDKGN